MALTDIFASVLNMSLTSSVVILMVSLARLILRRAPKIYSYALWALVLFRLLCPLSFESPFSLIPTQISSGDAVSAWSDDYIGENQIHFDNRPEFDAAVEAGRKPIPSGEDHFYVVTGNDGVSEPKTVENTLMPHFARIWIIGIFGMIFYSIISYYHIRKQTKVAVPFGKGIYIADDVISPFVMGLFRPVIYLPGTLDPSEQRYIIHHERHHIRRGDHIFKALGFLALTVHWFNPLVWVAFILAGRDMEMSCDEAVIRKLGEDVRAAYSASLLNLATGQRLFAGTPLAFGEGDPTGRVRNLAKWRKPAFWVIILCIVICIILAACLLTDPQDTSTDTPETEPPFSEETEPAETDDWGVSIVPERVSRTGATAIFTYPGSIPGQEDAELTYGDFLSLERLENGKWVEVEENPGYEYYVGDSSYPVTDGYGMVHEWEVRFGELPDGHYRLGKQVTLVRPDGTSEEQIIYGEFFLPDSILTGPIPLEDLPEKYSAEQAMLDGCFVQSDGVARDNKELFHQFATVTAGGVPSSIRIVNWYYGDDPHYTALDLNFDGSAYTISWLEDGQRISKQFLYLKHFAGEKERENMAYDAYEHYVLVNDNTVTWQRIWEGLISSQSGAAIEHMTVYSDYIYFPKKPQLPANLVQAVLEFEGESIVTVTDFDRLEKLYLLFDSAELLGYEPKTHSVGVDLNLILTAQSGETMTIELDPDSDLCRIDGEYIFYGAPDEPDYIEKLWYYLGLTAWPDAVYQKCPNALKP